MALLKVYRKENVSNKLKIEDNAKLILYIKSRPW